MNTLCTNCDRAQCQVPVLKNQLQDVVARAKARAKAAEQTNPQAPENREALRNARSGEAECQKTLNGFCCTRSMQPHDKHVSIWEDGESGECTASWTDADMEVEQALREATKECLTNTVKWRDRALAAEAELMAKAGAWPTEPPTKEGRWWAAVPSGEANWNAVLVEIFKSTEEEGDLFVDGIASSAMPIQKLVDWYGPGVILWNQQEVLTPPAPPKATNRLGMAIQMLREFAAREQECPDMTFDEEEDETSYKAGKLEDAQQIRKIADLLEAGKGALALQQARKLDSFIRDGIPPLAVEVLFSFEKSNED